MNNSEKQAAAFEPKWTCEEPETRRTLTATAHRHRSEDEKKRKLPQKKHIFISAYFFSYMCVLQMNRLLNEKG